MVRHTLKVLVEISAFLLGALLLFSLVAVWRLTQGPIDVDFLAPYVERAATDHPYELQIGSTRLNWEGFDSDLSIAAQDVSVFEVEETGGARRLVGRFPEVELGLAWGPLLRGEIVTKALTLNSPSLWAVRDQSGSIGIGFSNANNDQAIGDSTASGAVMRLSELLAAAPEEGGRAVLTTVNISDGHLFVLDQREDRTWRGEGLNASITRQPNAVLAVFDVSVETSAVGPVGFAQGSVNYGLSTGVTDVQLILDEIETAKLAELFLPNAQLPVVDVPIEGVVSAQFDEGIELKEAHFDIHAEDGSIDTDGALPVPFEFDRIGLVGHFAADQKRWEVDSLSVQADPMDLVLQGSVTPEDDVWNVVLGATATNIPVDRFEIYWPRAVAPAARRWVVVKTYGGMVDSFDAASQMRISRDGHWRREVVSLDGNFTASDLNLNPLIGLPPLRNLAGTAKFDLTGLYIDVPAATTLDADLSEGRVTITGFPENEPEVDIEFIAAGSLATGLYYLNRPRLSLIEKLGIPTEGSDGRTAGRVRLRFPLIPNLTFSDISAIAAVNIRDGTIQLTPNWQLQQTSATLSIDQLAVNLDGDGRIAEVPVSFTARRILKPDEDDPFETSVTFDAQLEAERLPDFGLPAVPSLSGPIDVEIDYQKRGDRQMVDVEADLADASLDVPRVDWEKPVGAPATFTSTIRLTDWIPLTVPAFAFEGAGLTLRGDAAFDQMEQSTDVELATLTVDELRLGENDLQGTISRRANDQGWQVEVSGPSLSLRPLVERVSIGGVEGVVGDGAGEDDIALDEPLVELPLVVDAQIDRVILGDDREVDRVRGIFSHDGDQWNSISLRGVATDDERGEETDISVRYSSLVTEGRNFWASTKNFGTFLNALNVTDQIYGGELAFSALLDVDEEMPAPGQPAIEGEVLMTSYRVVRAPAVAQLLVALALNGLRDDLDEEGILFNGLDADFTFDEGVLTVADGQTGGSGLGLTLEGTLDTKVSEINMDGTIVPIRGINRLLNQVPILGDLLGGEDEGLFAFTYKLRGPLDDPQASVNPLSVLAPGVLREIFRFDPVAPPEGFPLEQDKIGETD